MDYKELIEQLRKLLPQKVDYAEMVGAEAVHYGKSYVYEDPESYIIEATADAIKTLLAERDAAMRDLKGNCAFCIHRKLCMFGNHMRDICVNGSSWQWRGPQKEGEENG